MKPVPLNKELYDKIKEDIYTKYPKHSIYRSMMISREYQKSGGKYKDKKPKISLTEQWLNDKWVSANDWLHNKELILCGSSNTQKKFNEYPLCYTKKRLMTFTDEELRTLIKNKNILHSKHLMTKKMTGKGCCTECDIGQPCISGSGSGYKLHAVIIKKDVGLKEAKRLSANFIDPKQKHYYRTTGESYRFRNIPKTMFDPKTYRTKVVNDNISLVYGKLKKEGTGIFDKAKGLYVKAKDKAKQCRLNPVGCAFNFNYCGPFTKLEGQIPTNDVDKICLTHDYDYNRIDKMKKEGIDKSILEDEVRKADEKMLDALKYIPDSQQKTAGYKLAKYGIYGKTQLEDMGILPKTAFAGSGIKRDDDIDELEGEILRIRHPYLLPINKKYGGFVGHLLGAMIPKIFGKIVEKGVEKIKQDPMKVVNFITGLKGGAIDLRQIKQFV